MMKNITLLFLSFYFVGCMDFPARAAADNNLSFSPAAGISTMITTKDQDVTLTIKNGKTITSESIHVDTEKQLKLISEDYNFDGHPDFSISHLDDGMGTYTIYQIYFFFTKDGKFIAAQPKCSDEFINIEFSRKTRTLTNSYFADNQIKTCTVKY